MADRILIQNGTVFDGTGAPGVASDVLIEKGKVAQIAPHHEAVRRRHGHAPPRRRDRRARPGVEDVAQHEALRGRAAAGGEVAGAAPIRIRPKLLASTATVRRSRRQILSLFGRDAVSLFPPPGIDRRDSFFARTAPAREKNPRLYLGVAAQGRSLKVVLLRAYLALLGAFFDMERRAPPARAIAIEESSGDDGAATAEGAPDEDAPAAARKPALALANAA